MKNSCVKMQEVGLTSFSTNIMLSIKLELKKKAKVT